MNEFIQCFRWNLAGKVAPGPTNEIRYGSRRRDASKFLRKRHLDGIDTVMRQAVPIRIAGPPIVCVAHYSIVRAADLIAPDIQLTIGATTRREAARWRVQRTGAGIVA